jgi:cytochrome c oxidase subunit 2
MRSPLSALFGVGLAAMAGLFASAAAAAERIGVPHDWQVGFQEPGSPIMRELEGFHNGLLLPIISVICLFVLSLLVFVMVRFNARTNPTPSKNAHNTLVEVVWTVVPVAILIVIAIPSFRLLFHEGRIPEADLTVKAIGNTWFWDYEYPDHGTLAFTANIVPDTALKPGEPRLLTADHAMVVPVGKVVRMIITSNDVIHAWAVPAFGLKIDAVPGRLNETWFKAEREGIYYGQCSELCGQGHAFMPIEVHVVSEEMFTRWVEAAVRDPDAAQKLLAEADAAPVTVAAAEPAGAER